MSNKIAPFNVYTRCDHHFFPGLIGLINSLRSYHPNVAIFLIDTGLTSKEIAFLDQTYSAINYLKTDTRNYSLDASKKNRYNHSVFSGLEAELPKGNTLVHLDSDAIVLGSLKDLIEAAEQHGFAASGEIPASNMKTHFWGMAKGTGRELLDTTLEDQKRAYAELSEQFGKIDLDSITFNSGIWAASSRYYHQMIHPKLQVIKKYHKEIWGLEQAMLNLATYYSNPREPFKEVGSSFNSRAEYPYFNQGCTHIGYRIAPPRYVGQSNYKNARAEELCFNGVGGILKIIHYVWRPKPWELPQEEILLKPTHWAWKKFADLTPGWLSAYQEDL